MELLTIPKIADLIDVPESNLRYYHKKFKKYLPEVIDGKHKRFKHEAIEIFSFIADSFKSGSSSAAIEKELMKRYAVTIDIENEQQQEIKIQHIDTTIQQIEIFQDMVVDSLKQIVHEEIEQMKNEIASSMENKFDELISASRKEKYRKKGFLHDLIDLFSK
jgi:DNA-binding transcriptional MerR regulator